MKRTSSQSTPLRVALYLRCSTDDQRFGDYTTIDTQRSVNRAFAQAQGAQVVAEFTDEGKSGTNLSRSGWKTMLAAARERQFDTVIVTYMSRLARGEMYHAAEYLLSEARVTVRPVQEQFTPDLAGAMSKGFKVLLDGMYPLQVSEWTKTALRERAAAGWSTGGPTPFGYRTEPVPGMEPVHLPSGRVKPAPRRRVPDEERRAMALAAFEVMARTDNMAEVQRYLREVAPERAWSIDAVRRMMKSEAYRGVARFGDLVNPSAHEAIVPEELFDTVQQLLAARASRPARPVRYHKADRRVPVHFYLAGRVRCGHCDSLMTPGSHQGANSKVGYYECLNATKKKAPCPIVRVNASTLHAVALEEIARLVSHPTRFDRLWREAVRHLPDAQEARHALRRIERNLSETRKKAARLLHALKAGAAPALINPEIDSLAALETRQKQEAQRLEGEIAGARAVRPDTAGLRALWSRLVELWDHMSEDERSVVLSSLVESVTLSEKGKGCICLPLCSPLTQQSPLSNVWIGGQQGAGIAGINRNEASPAPRFAIAVRPNPPSLCVPAEFAAYRRAGVTHHELGKNR